MTKSSEKSRRTGNADQLAPGDAFTVDELIDILDRTKRRDWEMPEPPEIEKLLSILNFWKRHYYTAQEQRAFNEKLAEAEGLTTRLRELMPGIFEYRAAQADAGDPFSKTWAGSAERLLIALDYPGSTDGRPKVLDCFHREDLPTHVKDWRWLIDVLPVDYENAMRPANLSKTFGRSKGGPLARFLEAILPAVTGESRTAVAVGTQLRKSK